MCQGSHRFCAHTKKAPSRSPGALVRSGGNLVNECRAVRRETIGSAFRRLCLLHIEITGGDGVYSLTTQKPDPKTRNLPLEKHWECSREAHVGRQTTSNKCNQSYKSARGRTAARIGRQLFVNRAQTDWCQTSLRHRNSD